MAVVEWARFIAGAFFLLVGLGCFLVEMIGVFRFKYVLNRMHAAAMGDTLGIGASLVGLMLLSGSWAAALKLFLVVAFLWFSSPVSSHLIARLEVTTNEELEKECRIAPLEELEKEQKREQAEEGREEARS